MIEIGNTVSREVPQNRQIVRPELITRKAMTESGSTAVPLLFLRLRVVGCDVRAQTTFEDVLPYPAANVRLLQGSTKTTRVARETTDDS